MFFYKVEGHMPKLSSFGRGKTIRPKKSLTSLLHAALQLVHAFSVRISSYGCTWEVWRARVQEARVTLGYPSSNSYAFLVLSKLPV